MPVVQDLDSVLPAVSIDTLSHSYGQGAMRRRVLEDISLRINPGEVVLLTGPSGCGKTTLLTLIGACLLYTSPSPRDRTRSRMPSSA